MVGDSRCPIVDTWWQTETGGILISPLAGAMDLKPGSATLPFGVQPALVNADGEIQDGPTEGNLIIRDSWPGQMRTVYGDHQRFIDTYFRTYPGSYFTGDGCRRDEDGYYWITGRVDDVINVSGHRIGTAEVESALVSHPKVAEAAVVGFPHDVKGQGIYAYVTLVAEEAPSDELHKELIACAEIGPTPRRTTCSGRRPAEDPLGQDHAPHPAQDRRERAGPAGRHLDPGRPVGGGVAGGRAQGALTYDLPDPGWIRSARNGSAPGGSGPMQFPHGSPTMTTPLIADDHPLLRARAVQRVIPGVQLFEADSVEALYALADQHNDADLVLMDLNMPGAQGFNALVHMLAAPAPAGGGGVRARRSHGDAPRARPRCARLHSQVGRPDTIGHALGTILDGETWAPPEAHNVPPTGSEEREVGQRLRELTPQQFRVLQMLGAGRLNKQIAYDLNVSEATIKAHVTAILRKLGVTNRTQAVLMAGKLAIDDDAIVLPPEED